MAVLGLLSRRSIRCKGPSPLAFGEACQLKMIEVAMGAQGFPPRREGIEGILVYAWCRAIIDKAWVGS
jgi:hypothetical protein